MAAADFTYRGGPLLTAVEVFTVFWGSAWSSPPQSDLVGELNAFFDFVLTSELLDQLAEYSIADATIGHGTRTGTVTLADLGAGSSITDAALQQALQQQIATNDAFPRPGPNTLYFLYLPPGLAVVLGGSRSCQSFCGYHDAIDGDVFYAVMPYPDCSGCTGDLALLDAVTTTSSHELAEAITDPVPGQGWYDDANGEIGDICAWQTKTLGAYTVQLEWSNRANACV